MLNLTGGSSGKAKGLSCLLAAISAYYNVPQCGPRGKPAFEVC